MNREMKRSAKNIMHEVESLIIVGDVSLAEKRMRTNIKKSIFDASFFNKNIEAFQEEFTLIEPKALEEQIAIWKRTYEGLQSQYQNIKNILSVKLEELKKAQTQHQMALKLEDLISTSINDIADDFNKYEDYLRDTINLNYSRNIIDLLKEKLDPIATKVEVLNKKIKDLSLKITSQKKNVKTKRKKAIDQWVSNYSQYQDAVNYYNQGFSYWNSKIEEIDRAHNEFVQKIESIGDRIHEKTENKQYNDALTLTEERFPQILGQIENQTEEIHCELKDKYVKNRKLFPLFKTIEREWMLYQNVLENLTQQFRSKFQSSIEMDMKSNFIHKGKLLIDKSITNLKKELIEFEKKMNSMISQKKTVDKEHLLSNIRDIDTTVKEKSQNIKAHFDKAQLKFPQIQSDLQPFLKKWEKFQKSFKQDLNNIKSKFEEEILVNSLLNYAADRKINKVNLSEFASSVNVNLDQLTESIKKLKTQHRINLVFKSNNETVEIHNEAWRKCEALNSFAKNRHQALKNRAFSLDNYFATSITGNSFFKELPQIVDLAKKFKDKINDVKDEWTLKLNNYGLDEEYQVIERQKEKFFSSLSYLNQTAEKVLEKCEEIKQFADFKDKQENRLEDLINSKIHYLYKEVQKLKIKKYKKNISWFKSEQKSLEDDVDKIVSELESQKNQVLKKRPKILPVLLKIQKSFEKKKDLMLQNFAKAKQDLLDKISTLKLDDMREEIESLITKYKDDLNFKIQKAEKEVLQKIKIQDFIGAANKLKDDFRTQFEKELRSYEKNIKKKNKEFTKETPIFEIKYSFLIQKWELFLLNFLNLLQEKEVELQKTMIQAYIRMVIEALNEPYMPVDNIARDLKLKENLVKQRIMALIKNDDLSGKIDQKYNIYISEGVKIDKQIVDSLDAVRSKNVRAYLIFKRFGGIFRYITPIISLILGIGSYAASQPGSSSIAIAAPIAISLILIMPIVMYYIYWLAQGRKKAIKGKVIMKSQKKNKGKKKNTSHQSSSQAYSSSLEEELNEDTLITDFSDSDDEPMFKSPYSG